MYNVILEDMLEELEKAGLTAFSNRERAMEVLKSYWHDKVAEVWSFSDVLNQEEQNWPEMTDEDAMVILKSVHENMHTDVGINSVVISKESSRYMAQKTHFMIYGEDAPPFEYKGD